MFKYAAESIIWSGHDPAPFSMSTHSTVGTQGSFPPPSQVLLPFLLLIFLIDFQRTVPLIRLLLFLYILPPPLAQRRTEPRLDTDKRRRQGRVCVCATCYNRGC